MIMMYLRLLASAALSLAAASASPLRVHETASAPSSWHLVGPADPSATVHLSIALSQPRLSDLKKRLSEISDLSHPSFGAHLSQAQVRAFRQPDADALAAVSQWLTQGGVRDARRDADAYLRFNASVPLANALLNTTLAEYRSPRGGLAYRATEYSLPTALAPHIRFVYPVTQFVDTATPGKTKRRVAASLDRQGARAARRRSTDSLPGSCRDYVSPDCLVDLYNITYIPADAQSGSTLGIGGFLEEYPNEAALHQFLSVYGPRRNTSGGSSAYNFTVVSIAGGNTTDAGSGGDGEALLDTFYTMAFTQPLPVTYLSTGGRGMHLGADGSDMSNSSGNANEPWLEFAEGLLAMPDSELPKVLSLSYTDDEQSTPRAYAEHVCDLFAQLAARGVSALVASGDSGASGVDRGDCMVLNSTTQRFLATFPASCPYVTAVGATELSSATPASWSGGGFSEYFAAPEWQKNDTAAYVQWLNGSHAGWFNPAGRGFPDLTLVGVRYVLQAPFTTKGTSASTPVVAAMVALLNDKRMRSGKGALGWLNPVLYSEEVRTAMTDLTAWNIGGCLKPDGTPEIGYSAAKGWDPATGLGAPDFAKLLEVLG